MSSACEAFLSAHFSAHPEDASSLGIHAYAGRLSDPSEQATRVELAELRVCLRALENESHGDDGARLDADAALRRARFAVRALEADVDATNLERALLPNAALVHTLLHAVPGERERVSFEALASRAHEVPAFLEAVAENLRRGARDGRAPDRDVVTACVDRLLPAAAQATSTLASEARRRGATESTAARIDERAREASRAYTKLARTVREEIAPHARPCVRLGERETCARLRDMGVDHSLADLHSLAREILEHAHAEIARISGEKYVHNAREALACVTVPTHASAADAVRCYRREVDRATEIVRERKLVPVPHDLALAFEPLPAGIADGAALTNWPAPLFDSRGRGHALYNEDASAHAIVATKNLAVHEAIPGHYLQSVVWQRAFAGGPATAAARFLGVADDVAFADGFFGTMMSVEGWAVHMEHTLRDEGFYDTDGELLFFALCEAIRAARVITDLSLHAGDASERDLVRLIEDATLLPEAWARRQVLRAKRLPLQGLTYAVGALEIAALRDRAGGDSLSFYADFLARGPIPPSRFALTPLRSSPRPVA